MSTDRILVVEDEAVTSLAIVDTLEAFGYEPVGPVAFAEEAIEVATREVPNLILMDIRLKGEMDGITAAAKIWNSLSIPIIFLTAYSDEETLSRAKLGRPFGFILKPYRDQELHATIQLALSNFRSDHPALPQTAPEEAPVEDLSETIDFGATEISAHSFLKRVEPIRKLPDTVLTQIARASSFKTYRNNSYINHEGDSLTETFIVASGRIALIKSSFAGKELIVALLPPGDVFNVAMALEEAPATYAALSHGETTILSIPVGMLRTAFADEPQLYKEFYEELTERIQRSHTFSLRLAHDRVEVRVAAALLELDASFGRSKGDESTSVVHVTRQQLAQIAGTTPETTIRLTRSMEKSGIVDLSQPGRIKILKVDLLEGLAEDAVAFDEID